MEFWKPLLNFPNYEGSTEGRIRCVRTQRVQKPTRAAKGYAQVSLYENGKRRIVKVRRVIAETFIGEHPGLDVRNKDGDGMNCRLNNLEYITRSDLVREAYERGTKIPPHRTPVRIVETGEEFNSISSCAKDIGCHKQQIYDYFLGKLHSVKGLHFEKI